MWSELIATFNAFPSAVLSGIDADGLPASIRTTARVDTQRQAVRVEVPALLELQPGPASLLCHRHDEQLWNMHTTMVRGRLEHDGEGMIFRPLTIVPGAGSDTLSALRMIASARTSARAYLQKRGLSRPRIPWDKLKAAKG